MRMCLCFLALAVLASNLDAGDPEKKPVREVFVKVFPKGEPKAGGPRNPTVIKGTEDLAKAVDDETTRNSIGKEVDFAKEQLLYFSWGGSGGDKLTIGSYDAKANAVVFAYKGGLTRDLRSHNLLFALPKGATWKVEPGKGK